MWEVLYSTVFAGLQAACGVVLFIRFRGSIGAVLGGAAFGLWVLSGLSQAVLNAFDVQWWSFGWLYTFFNLTSYCLLLAALITGRTTGGNVAAVQPPVAEAPAVDPALVGIGGWLVLPAIGFAAGPVLGIVGLGVLLSLFSDVSDAGYGGVMALEMLVNLVIIAFTIYVAVRFFGKKRNVPRLFISLIVVGVVASGLLLVADMGAGAEEFAMQQARTLLLQLVGAGIWIPYFIVSKRVKATFVN